MFKEILVIDDNPDIRFLVCSILEEQNFKVRTAGTDLNTGLLNRGN